MHAPNRASKSYIDVVGGPTSGGPGTPSASRGMRRRCAGPGVGARRCWSRASPSSPSRSASSRSAAGSSSDRSRSPGSPQTRAPVLFLFHGRGGDERSWMAGQDGSGVGVDAVAHGMISAGTIGPLVIVSARIDDSYGVDSLPAADGYDHGPYERYIIENLVPAIEARYPVGGDPADRVAGLDCGHEVLDDVA